MAQSPVRRPVSQVEDFKARFGVVQGQRGSDPRNPDMQAFVTGGSGFNGRQMIAAIVLAVVAGMSGAGVFWFAQDFGSQKEISPQSAASSAPANAPEAQPATPAPQPAQSSSLLKSDDADSPVLAAGDAAGTAAAQTEQVAVVSKPVQEPLPEPAQESVVAPAATPVIQPPAAAESPAPQPVVNAPEPVIAAAQPPAQPEASPVTVAQPPQAEVASEPVQPVVAEPATEPETVPPAAEPVEPQQDVALLTQPQPVPAPVTAAVPAIAAGQVWKDCEACPELVAVVAPKPASPGVDLKFTASEEVPGIVPFAIGRFEVTFDDWARCVAAAGCAEMPANGGWGEGPRPVINVSYQMIAEQYLPWLSAMSGKTFRLPTSQEWDLADAGGEARLGRSVPPLTSEALCRSANFAADASCADPYEQTAPVGSLEPNLIGLQDMRGNVWEWVSDCWTPGFNYKAKPSERDCRKHLVRGGGWSSQPALAAVAPKGFEDQMRVSKSIGFRVARSLP